MEKSVLQRVARFFKGLFSGKMWHRIWSKDWVLKFVSLLLATVLWYFVGGEDTVDKNVVVPIEIINMPRDLVISNQFKKDIEVTVSGPRSLIQEMASRNITRQINLSSATPGTNVIQNDNDSIPVPRGITVLRIQPSSIILSLDKLIQKHFPVTPVTTGDVASGYVLQQLKMEPDVITITGPETILAQVDELRTKIIDINSMNESKQLQIPLDLEPAIVDLIGETSVTADIVVSLKTVQKYFNGVDIVAAVDGIEREVTPAKVNVIANIPVILIKKGVDLSKMFTVTAIPGADEETMTVKVIPRDDLQVPIEIVSIQPRTVTLVQIPEGVEEKKQTFKEQAEPVQKVPEVAPVPGAVVPPQNEKVNTKETTAVPVKSEPKTTHITSDKKKIIIKTN